MSNHLYRLINEGEHQQQDFKFCINDSKKIAKLLRAGLVPMADVYPKAMRSTRDLLRRRMHFVRERADLLTHIQQTNHQYNLPKIGKTLKYKGNLEGVAERFEDASARKTVETITIR